MKTRIGLSATAVACIAFLLAFYGGYVALILLTGYVLLCEANDWLRSTVVKALVLSLAFSVCYTLLGLIPNLLDTINSIIRTFGEQGITVLLIEQNANMALKSAHYGYVMETGRITIQGSGASLLEDETIREAYLGKKKA